MHDFCWSWCLSNGSGWARVTTEFLFFLIEDPSIHSLARDQLSHLLKRPGKTRYKNILDISTTVILYGSLCDYRIISFFNLVRDNITETAKDLFIAIQKWTLTPGPPHKTLPYWIHSSLEIVYCSFILTKLPNILFHYSSSYILKLFLVILMLLWYFPDFFIYSFHLL